MRYIYAAYDNEDNVIAVAGSVKELAAMLDLKEKDIENLVYYTKHHRKKEYTTKYPRIYKYKKDF